MTFEVHQIDTQGKWIIKVGGEETLYLCRPCDFILFLPPDFTLLFIHNDSLLSITAVRLKRKNFALIQGIGL